jgi:hypothetical protein
MPAVKHAKKKAKKFLKGIFVVTKCHPTMNNKGNKALHAFTESYKIASCAGGMSNPNVERYVTSWSNNSSVLAVTLVDEKLQFTELYRNPNIQI